MPKPTEHKTVQARILAYAQQIGWTYVPRAEAERRRGFDRSQPTAAEQAAQASPYFDDLLDSQVRKLNPKYADGPGALVCDLRRLHADIAGNRDFLAYLRNTKTFYDKGDGRELNLVLIDYEHPTHNVFEVTEEFTCHNGKHGIREDVVFLINGIPVLVIECKNATKDEAIALGVDQVRRYHAETPTVLVLIDRNELEDQMLRNLAALGLNNVRLAHSIAELNKLLKDDLDEVTRIVDRQFSLLAKAT